MAWAHWMSAFLPSQSTLSVDSSGLAVAQSITVWMPTSAAGSEDGSVRSAWRGRGWGGIGGGAAAPDQPP